MPVILLSELLGQPDAQRFLRHTVASGRYANAYLFHGPAGVGKGTAALAFARALLCERINGTAGIAATPGRLDATDSGPAGAGGAGAKLNDACGECAACRKTAALQHPDLKFLFPVSGEEKELDETIIDTLEAWREDPLFVFTYDKAASIRMSLTRDLLRDLAYKPYEAARRVVVVRDADRMRLDQYSAMLKAIEEPGDTVWLLTTSRLSRLPATIRSRTQKVRFAPYPESLVAEFMVSRVGCDPAESRMLAALSCGSLSRALVLREGQPIAARNQALKLLEPALRGDGPALWLAVQGFNKFGRAGRESLRRLIEFQELWLRDLLRARYGAPREDLLNRDREPEIRRQAERIGATEVRRRLMALEEALRAIEGNVTPDLALFSALMRVADPGFETTAWPAYAAGRWRY